MKSKNALTTEQIERFVNEGKEKLIAKKNEAIAAVEKKYFKELQKLDEKYKLRQKKDKSINPESGKESTIKSIKIRKKEIEQLHKDGKSINEIASHFEVKNEVISDKLKSLGLLAKKNKK